MIFDGQSLPVYPSVGHVNSFPKQMLATRPDLAFGIVAQGSLSWQQLDNDVPSRVGPYVNLSPLLLYNQVGGTTQVSLHQAAATIYASEGAIIDLVKALHTNVVVIGTTTTPSTGFDAAANVILADLNNLKRADASGFYDVLVDLAADPSLDDPADTTYYVDGTHPTTAGAAVMASLIGTAVDTLLAA